MTTDDDDTLLSFALPSLGKKKVTAAFDLGSRSPRTRVEFVGKISGL